MLICYNSPPHKAQTILFSSIEHVELYICVHLKVRNVPPPPSHKSLSQEDSKLPHFGPNYCIYHYGILYVQICLLLYTTICKLKKINHFGNINNSSDLHQSLTIFNNWCILIELIWFHKDRKLGLLSTTWKNQPRSRETTVSARIDHKIKRTQL